MTNFNSPYVYYLEESDFINGPHGIVLSSNYNTQPPLFANTVIIMVQGNYCGYCTQLKPTFQQLAEDLSQNGLDFATIQIDSKYPSEKIFQTDALASFLKGPLQGVPLIVKVQRGEVIDKFTGERNYNSLRNWILS